MINKKLQHEIMSIHDIDPKRQQTKRLQWMFYNNERAAMIAEAKKQYDPKKLKTMSKAGRKAIAKAYSNLIVAWDAKYASRTYIDYDPITHKRTNRRETKSVFI